VCGPESDLGRPPGTDLTQEVWTLPVILGLRVDAGLLENLPGSARDAAPEVAARLARTGALQCAHATAVRALDVAVDQAPVLEPFARWLGARADRALEEVRAIAPKPVAR
jgi:geranylgeranyl pyrophosphate synthase